MLGQLKINNNLSYKLILFFTINFIQWIVMYLLIYNNKVDFFLSFDDNALRDPQIYI